MNTKLITLVGLLGVQAAPSPGKNYMTDPKFPLYPNVVNISNLQQAQALATAALGGYQCIRSDQYYAFPQAIVNNAVASSTDYKAFYGTAVAENGTAGTNTDCCIKAD